MKAWEIADTFRAAFVLDAAFNGKTLNVAQTGQKNHRPALLFECTCTPMNATASALTFSLTVWVESNADRQRSTDPDPAEAHAALVDAVRNKLVGVGKANLREQVNSGGDFDFRGWSGAASAPTVSELHFSTPVQIEGVALVL